MEAKFYDTSKTDALLAAKQATIDDLGTIRSGASAGATAVQSFSDVGGASASVESGVADLSALFSSDNTSFNAENCRVSASVSTSIKSYIDTTVGTIETALSEV